MRCMTSLNNFKSAYTDMLPDYSCKFTVKINRGTNFKIGISDQCRICEKAFSDVSGGMAYYSMAQLRDGSAS